MAMVRGRGILTAWHQLRSKGTTAGWPDLAIIYRDVLHCWELKRMGRWASPAQSATIEALRNVTRIDAAILLPDDLEHVERSLGYEQQRRGR